MTPGSMFYWLQHQYTAFRAEEGAGSKTGFSAFQFFMAAELRTLIPLTGQKT